MGGRLRFMLDAGAEPDNEPWDAFRGRRYAETRDPESNVVDLLALLSG